MKACKMRNICFCRLSIQAIYRSSGAVAADVRPPSKTLASASPLTHSRLSQLEVMLNSALLQALSNQHNRLPLLSVPLASRLISSLFTTLRPAAPPPHCVRPDIYFTSVCRICRESEASLGAGLPEHSHRERYVHVRKVLGRQDSSALLVLLLKRGDLARRGDWAAEHPQGQRTDELSCGGHD